MSFLLEGGGGIILTKPRGDAVIMETPQKLEDNNIILHRNSANP